MQIAFWSNMHGQGATTANTAAVACMVSQTTAYRTLVAHSNIEKNHLEKYLLRRREQVSIRMLDYSNQGMDALVRLYRNGRLKPEMIPDYTYSLMKNHSLDILFGSEKGESFMSDNHDFLLSIFECAKDAYDIIMLDLHSGLNEKNSKLLSDKSDIVVFCINQNRILLENFKSILEQNPKLSEKRTAYVIGGYERESSLTRGNISREYDINPESLFVIPRHAGFMDACNNGRVFDFITYGLNSRRGVDFAFSQEVKKLSQYISEGCLNKA